MASNRDIYGSLGTWAGDDLNETLLDHTGVGSDDDMPDDVRFVSGVVQLLLRRDAELKAKGTKDDDDIAIFVLIPSPPDSITRAEREPMLNSGLIPVVGRLWFTPAPVVAAHYVDLPKNTNDDGRVSYVTGLGLGSIPTLIFDPRTERPELRWYSEGLDILDNVKVKPIAGDVNIEEVLATIDALYRQCLITPGVMAQGGKLWINPGLNWVRKDAEASVQLLVKAGLSARFPYCNVRHEQTQAAGRSDLEIEQAVSPRLGGPMRYGVLELKVLRSFGSTGRAVTASHTNEWIREGVRQAAAYRKGKSTQWAALCCFDMRAQDSGHDVCFAPVKEAANALDVNLGRWFLYASAQAQREAEFTI